jgi:hypothetical protein
MSPIDKLNALMGMKQGTRILYIPSFGDGVPEEVSFHELITRGGEYIVHVETNSGGLRWGYLNQIALI